MIIEGSTIQPPAYERSAEVVSVSVSPTEEDRAEMRCVSFKRAAEELGVSQPRISAFVAAERLDVRLVKGQRMITLDSIYRYEAKGDQGRCTDGCSPDAAQRSL